MTWRSEFVQRVTWYMHLFMFVLKRACLFYPSSYSWFVLQVWFVYQRQTPFDKFHRVNVHICFRILIAEKHCRLLVLLYGAANSCLLIFFVVWAFFSISSVLTEVDVAAPTVRRQHWMQLRRPLERLGNSNKWWSFQVSFCIFMCRRCLCPRSLVCSWSPRIWALIVNFVSLAVVSLTLIVVAWREVRSLLIYCNDFSIFWNMTLLCAVATGQSYSRSRRREHTAQQSSAGGPNVEHVCHLRFLT